MIVNSSRQRQSVLIRQVCAEEAGGLGEDGSRGHDGVLLFFKEVEEAGADLCGGHDGGFRIIFEGKGEV